MTDASSRDQSHPENASHLESESNASELLAGGHAGAPQRVLMSPEQGNEWPFWDFASGSPLSAEDLNLPTELSAEVAAWTRDWYKAADDHMNRDLQGPLHLSADWFNEGDALMSRVAHAVHPGIALQGNFHRYRA